MSAIGGKKTTMQTNKTTFILFNRLQSVLFSQQQLEGKEQSLAVNVKLFSKACSK